MRAYQEAVVKGNHSPQTALLLAYGIHLMNGGTPDTFGQLSREDADIMLATYLGLQMHERIKLLEGFATILGKMFGGQRRWRTAARWP